MDIQHPEALGSLVEPNELRCKRAVSVYAAIHASPFAEVIETRLLDTGEEIIITDLMVETPQYPVYDIRHRERAMLFFSPDNTLLPRAFMLREDFPETPHLLLEPFEKPRSLCLYDMAPEEANVTWTGPQFLFRVRNWLQLTALGQLHQEDQPLERLLANFDGDLLIDIENEGPRFQIYEIPGRKDGRYSFFASNRPVQMNASAYPCRVEYIRGQPQIHGLIKRKPGNLHELAEVLNSAQINLVEELAQRLPALIENENDRRCTLVLLIELPKLRSADSDVIESIERFAFMVPMPLAEISIAMGIAGITNGIFARLLFSPLTPEGLRALPVAILNLLLPITKNMALYINSLPDQYGSLNITMIGCGAIGSQFALNVVRSGTGLWTFVDGDHLYPHNLIRHALTGASLLRNKASELAKAANSIIKGIATSIDVTVQADMNDVEINNALDAANLVIDMSASSAVLKSLAGRTRGQIVSCSLNPAGDNLVLFAEDAGKSIHADQLEVQYLRWVHADERLSGHFATEGAKFRYGVGCRDVSLKISQDNIAMAAGIACKVFKNTILASPEGQLSIWMIDEQSGEVTRCNTPVFRTLVNSGDAWTIKYDEYVVDKIAELRLDKLPNETGGLLLGNYDMIRKIIYVADIIASPPDSVEYPTAYIRGTFGVKEALDRLDKTTAGSLQYIGEWHSHPEGVPTEMSDDDLVLFDWLGERMAIDGYPALLAIAGDEKALSFYIN